MYLEIAQEWFLPWLKQLALIVGGPLFYGVGNPREQPYVMYLPNKTGKTYHVRVCPRGDTYPNSSTFYVVALIPKPTPPCIEP